MTRPRPAAADLRDALSSLQDALHHVTQEHTEHLASLPAANQASARNLLHYLEIGAHAPVQAALQQIGLAPLATDDVAGSLARAVRWLDQPADAAASAAAPQASPDVRQQRAERLFGTRPQGITPRIMVTLPGDAHKSEAWLDSLIQHGMDIARINCSRDNPNTWHDLALALKQAEERSGKPCKRSFELAGPKLRIGKITPRPAVLKWKPERSDAGRTVAPCQVHFYIVGDLAPRKAEHAVPIDEVLVREARAGDTLRVKDVRGKRRDLHIMESSGNVLLCETEDTAYVSPGTNVQLRRGTHVVGRGHVGDLPQKPGYVELSAGDKLVLLQGTARGQPATRRADGSLAAAILSCELEGVFTQVRAGARIRLDDGKVEGVVEQADTHRLDIRITQAENGKVKLKGERGINLPDTPLHLPSLTDQDIEHLAQVLPDAELIAMSFVQTPEDVNQMLDLLRQHEASHVGLILKIETANGVKNLPQILLAALAHPQVAVMIARGDLAAEIGFAALANTQKTILSLCEASHIPVIWATQVLETMAKKGVPSRAEVSDVFMANQADCVMLNKGPYIIETLAFLHDLLKQDAAQAGAR